MMDPFQIGLIVGTLMRQGKARIWVDDMLHEIVVDLADDDTPCVALRDIELIISGRLCLGDVP